MKKKEVKILKELQGEDWVIKLYGDYYDTKVDREFNCYEITK